MRIERRAGARRACLALAASFLGPTACNGVTSYLDATGVQGHDAAVLGWWLTGAASAVVAIVCAIILAAIVRHRGAPRATGTDGLPEPPTLERRNVSSGLRWIYVGMAATMAVLCVAFAGTMVTLSAASRPRVAGSLTLDVIGHQWWWEVRYAESGHPELGFTTANEIHLPVGQPVRVRLHSADVIHSFWVPQLAGKMDIVPGQVNETWLEATRPATSRGMCAEYCGLEHAMMSLPVTAEAPARFVQWANERRAGGVVPSEPTARAGRVVFVRSCGACHAVAGTDALGRFGPDLSHVASRPWIGAGALPNTTASLERWILNAPAVKEGARMPAIPLDAAELHAVVAYLRTLR